MFRKIGGLIGGGLFLLLGSGIGLFVGFDFSMTASYWHWLWVLFLLFGAAILLKVIITMFLTIGIVLFVFSLLWGRQMEYYLDIHSMSFIDYGWYFLLILSCCMILGYMMIQIMRGKGKYSWKNARQREQERQMARDMQESLPDYQPPSSASNFKTFFNP